MYLLHRFGTLEKTFFFSCKQIWFLKSPWWGRGTGQGKEGLWSEAHSSWSWIPLTGFRQRVRALPCGVLLCQCGALKLRASYGAWFLAGRGRGGDAPKSPANSRTRAALSGWNLKQPTSVRKEAWPPRNQKEKEICPLATMEYYLHLSDGQNQKHRDT